MTGVELATLCLIKSTPPSPPEVEVDRIPELRGEMERLRARTERFQRQPPQDQAKEQSGPNYLDQGVSRAVLTCHRRFRDGAARGPLGRLSTATT